MTQNNQSTQTSKLSYMRSFVLACLVFTMGAPSISSAQMNSSDPKAANAASLHSNAMTEGKEMAFKKSMDEMHQKMSSMSMTGNTDLDFAIMMKEHHQGAIDMAEIELKQGKDPKLQKMASKIIAAQKKEIAEFDAWLKKHTAGMGANQPGKK